MTWNHPTLSEEEFEQRVAGFMADPFDGWMWLSFADPHLDEGEQFLGVAIVPGANVVQAAVHASMLGCNPGGEVIGYPIPDEHLPELELRCRLLSEAELHEHDLIEGREE